EHRTVLETADDRADLLNADEIVEVLRDEWRLVLNIDPETNLDEDAKDLGITGWRCILRCDPPAVVAPMPGSDEAEEEGTPEKAKAEPEEKPAKTEEAEPV